MATVLFSEAWDKKSQTKKVFNENSLECKITKESILETMNEIFNHEDFDDALQSIRKNTDSNIADNTSINE